MIYSYKLLISIFDAQINVQVSVVCRNCKTVIGFCIQNRHFEAPNWSTNYHCFVLIIISRTLKWFVPFILAQFPYRCNLYRQNCMLLTLIMPVCYRNYICSSKALYLLQSRRNRLSLPREEVNGWRPKPTMGRKMWLSSFKKAFSMLSNCRAIRAVWRVGATSALWRPDARRVVPLLGVPARAVEGRGQGADLSVYDWNNARAPMLNPPYDTEYEIPW